MDVGDAPSFTVHAGSAKFRLADNIVRSGSDGAPMHDGASSGVVFANEIARAAMLSEQPATFPIGSIIVREKLKQATDSKPKLLAVMIKRDRGFNPKSGDWQYFIANGSLTTIKQQKQSVCANCHASQKVRDYVFPLAPAAPAK